MRIGPKEWKAYWNFVIENCAKNSKIVSKRFWHKNEHIDISILHIKKFAYTSPLLLFFFQSLLDFKVPFQR